MTYQIASNNTVSLFVILIHIASLLILIPLSLPLWCYGSLILLLAISALLILHKTAALPVVLPAVLPAVLQLPLAKLTQHYASIRQFSWDSNGVWRVWTTDGREHEVELQPGSSVYSWLVLLNFKSPKGSEERRRFSLLLTEKQLPPQEFRRLRVRLGLQLSWPSDDLTS